jgi:hypothetical protein
VANVLEGLGLHEEVWAGRAEPKKKLSGWLDADAAEKVGFTTGAAEACWSWVVLRKLVPAAVTAFVGRPGAVSWTTTIERLQVVGVTGGGTKSQVMGAAAAEQHEAEHCRLLKSVVPALVEAHRRGEGWAGAPLAQVLDGERDGLYRFERGGMQLGAPHLRQVSQPASILTLLQTSSTTRWDF